MRSLAAVFIIMTLSSALQCSAETAPDPGRDTISPIYDFESFPYTWREIRDQVFPITPVHWRRHPASPVVSAGMNPRPVWWNPSTIRVFYGWRGRGHGIHYFDVNPKTPHVITAGPTGPIVSTGPQGSYDADWAIAPEPVRLSEKKVRLYYSAKKTGNQFFKQLWSLAVAESEDNGQTWRKSGAGPVLTVGSARWECGAVGFCSVEKDERGWRMWYLGTDDEGGEKALKQVGFATSVDGLKWERYEWNPVIAVNPDLSWERGAIAVPRVIRDGKLYKVWYCCYEKNVTYAVGQAESFDGIHWFRSPHNPVLTGSGQGWDSNMAAYPGVIRAGEKYLMWYSGNGYGGQGIGLAVADAPKGAWLCRTGVEPQPDKSWSAWQPVGETEPPRTGRIQFAVRADAPPTTP